MINYLRFAVIGGTLLLAAGCPTTQTGSPYGFCSTVDCGAGSCNEASGTCDCDAGFVFDDERLTCTGDGVDLCAGVICGTGQFCDTTTGTCSDSCTPDRSAGEFDFCLRTDDAGYVLVVAYTGDGELDLTNSQTRLNGSDVDLASSYDAATRTMTLRAADLAPSKYSYLFRMKDSTGRDIDPLFVPMWIGRGMRYADFGWRDSILYQIFTDRFLNGNRGNDIDNSVGDLARVTDVRSQWQGGDFAGIIAKIRDGYFEDMGINTLWISSPLLNSHNSQPAVAIWKTERFGSYHGYHPVVSGYTYRNRLGYENPIEPAFGTPAELHELVNEAHKRGIRVIPDLVVNHVQREARLFADHPGWFFSYERCGESAEGANDGNWDRLRVSCWFTVDMPDFDFGGNTDAIDAMVEHSVWLAQEFNFDGFRADALKHIDDRFTRALKAAIVERVETTVDDHTGTDEATVFYIVGESLGGWARYHVRLDMVQGQVDEGFYNNSRDSLLTFSSSMRDLANFAVPNDTAYLTAQDTMGGRGGYAGAVMGNFIGNHDQVRVLTQAGGSYERLRLAQTFLMTSPGNIPMLYQGDDIGTLGEADPDNRKMQRFDGLSVDEQASIDNFRTAGLLREQHVALRRGTRSSEVVEDWFWVYKVEYQDDVVYVALNRDADKSWSPPAGYVDGLGNCSGGTVPTLSSCIFVRR